jgi:hypothetical protein
VAAADASFCDVGERLIGLGEAKPDPDPLQEYESFGDLIDEDADTAEEPTDADHESFEDLMAEVSSEGEVIPAAGAAGAGPGDTINDAAPTLAAGDWDSGGVAGVDLGDTLSKGPGDTLSKGPGDTLSGGGGDSASEPGDSAAGEMSKPRRKKKISFV